MPQLADVESVMKDNYMPCLKTVILLLLFYVLIR